MLNRILLFCILAVTAFSADPRKINLQVQGNGDGTSGNRPYAQCHLYVSNNSGFPSDDSLNAATIVNTACILTNGFVGRAFDFNGVNSAMNAGNIPGPNWAGHVVTIAFNVLAISPPSGAIFYSYDNNNSLAGNEYYMYESAGTGTIHLSAGSEQDTGVSNATINDGNWHHIVIAIGGSQEFYIDGTLRATVIAANNGADASWVFRWGFPENIGAWAGTIDEMQIYGTTLQAPDVVRLYSQFLLKTRARQ